MAKLWPGHDSGIHKHTRTDRVNSICPSAILWRGHNKRPQAKCPRRLKCQYVVNMSIAYMFKKSHQRRWQIKQPPTSQPHSRDQKQHGPWKTALCTSKHIQLIYCYFTKLLIDSICLTDTLLFNTETRTVYQTAKRDRIVTIYTMWSMRNNSKCVNNFF